MQPVRCNCLQLLAAAVMLATASAAGQQAASSGYISPPTKVPDFSPAVWNQAYKLTLRNVPASHSSKEVLQSLWFPNTMLMGVQMPQDCSRSGFDSTDAAGAKLVGGRG